MRDKKDPFMVSIKLPLFMVFVDFNMKIEDGHKTILLSMGLKKEDFGLFDGEFVRYEYDEKKGVRIYDPYYKTSYNEYIGIDGWSAWSREKDTFMSDILKGAQEEAERRQAMSPKPDQEEISEALRKKFGEKKGADSE